MATKLPSTSEITNTATAASLPVADQPSDVRFSMRALLLMMVGVSLAGAAMGPYFRSLKPEQRTTVSILWSVCGVIVVGWVAWHGRTRYRLEREAGRKLLALVPRGRWIRYRHPWLTILGGCLWIAFGLYYLVLRAMLIDLNSNAPVWDTSMIFMSLFSAIFISLGIATIWWNREVQLRENGILYGLRLLQWSHVTRHEWKVGGLVFDGIDQLHADIQIAVNVRPNQRMTVESLVAEKVHGRVRKAPSEMPGENAAVVALPPIPISPRQNVSWRRIMMGLAVYIALIMTMTIRPWGRTPFEFNMGAFVAIGLSFVVSLMLRRPVKTAGAPLIRLRVGTDWRLAVLAFLTALGSYYIHQHLPYFHPVLSSVLGFVSGLGLVVLFQMILRDQIDLCENGIVLKRWDYWPWDTVRIAKWNPTTAGRLVMKRGWRRVIAKVRRHEAAAVDAVLKDKIGAEPPA